MNLYVRLASIPLRIKLVIGLMVGALATIAILFVAIVQYSQSGTPALHTMVDVVTQDRLDTLNLVITNASAVAAQLTNDPEDIGYYANLSANPGDNDSQRAVQVAFQLILNQEPTFQRISLIGLNGQVITSVPPTDSLDESKESYYLDLKDHLPDKPSYDIYVGGLGEANAPDANMDFVGVAVTANRPLGYIVIDVDPAGTANSEAASVYKAIKTVDSPLGAISFYLVSREGGIVTSGGDKPVPSNATTTASQKTLIGYSNKTAFDYTSPLSGRPVTGLGLPVGNTGITLVGEILTTPFGVSNESRQFLLPLLGLLFASILLISVASFFVIGTIVSPVEYLLEIANQAVQGRGFDDPDPIKQRDELGKLYEAFIAITRRLRYDIKSLEDRISQRTHDVEATRDIGQALSGIRQQDVLLKKAVALIREYFPEIDYAQVYLVNERRQSAVLQVSSASSMLKEEVPLDRVSPIVDAIERNKAIVTLEQSGQKNLLPDARSGLSLPLVVANSVIGVLNLQSGRVDTFTEAAIRLYQTIADQMSITINNAVLFEESQTRLNEIEALNRQLIGEGWRQFSSGKRHALLGASTNNSELNEWSDLQRRAIQSGDIVEQSAGDLITFAVPVSLRGQVIGAVEWDLPRDLYNEDNRQLARELATRLAISADNARLFEQAQRIAQRERLVNEISGKLTQQTNVSEILKIAVREVGQALHVPQTSIRLATSRDESEQDKS